jgi:hypothetical protein
MLIYRSLEATVAVVIVLDSVSRRTSPERLSLTSGLLKI